MSDVYDMYPILTEYWFIACQSNDLDSKPFACTVLGQHLVLFRTVDGKAVALRDCCPHRNAPLSKGWVRDNYLVCPYHGWQFDGRGECQAVPGLCGESQHISRNIPSYPLIEQEGFIWVFPNLELTPHTLPYSFPFKADRSYISFVGQTPFHGVLLDALENFLDATHTHFVHAGIVRTQGKRKRVTATIKHLSNGVQAEYMGEGQQSGLISRVFGAGIDVSVGRFLLPSIVELEYKTEDHTKLLVSLCFTPQDKTTLNLFGVISGHAPKYLAWVGKLIGRLFFSVVVGQDKTIVELQTNNWQRFGSPEYVYTELDVLRPYILRLLTNKPIHHPYVEKQIQMLL